jgi:uncharacterized protein
MRLTNNQTTTIKNTVAEVFGSETQVFLFGSRVDDTRRGGDIDLLVVSNLTEKEIFDRKIKMLSHLSLKLGEQKIDVITTANANRDQRLIVKEALEKGIKLS